MPWLEINLVVQQSEAENAGDALESAGALAITMQNPGEGQVLEPGVGETPLWPQVRVTGLFPADADQNLLREQMLSFAIVQRPDQLQFAELADQEWERSWMDRFKPMQFGKRLWVYPSNIDSPQSDDVILRLDPGLAFGTGTHATTALCLRWLEAAQIEGNTVVDYGCGSGILAIAATLLGAQSVIAVDNDPQALAATRENATRNAVSEKIQTVTPEAFSARQADVVLANILSGPLMDLAPQLAGCLQTGGQIVLSGILENQAEAVRAAYSHDIQWQETRVEDGWVRLSGMKK